MHMDVEKLYELRNLAMRPREATQDARQWLLDCFGEPEDQEDIRNLSALQVIQSVETHYEGGWIAFLREGFNIKDAA